MINSLFHVVLHILALLTVDLKVDMLRPTCRGGLRERWRHSSEAAEGLEEISPRCGLCHLSTVSVICSLPNGRYHGVFVATSVKS